MQLEIPDHMLEDLKLCIVRGQLRTEQMIDRYGPAWPCEHSGTLADQHVRFERLAVCLWRQFVRGDMVAAAERQSPELG